MRAIVLHLDVSYKTSDTGHPDLSHHAMKHVLHCSLLCFLDHASFFIQRRLSVVHDVPIAVLLSNKSFAIAKGYVAIDADLC